MAGGHSTARGIDFQAQVAAWFAAHLLAEIPLNELRGSIPKPVDIKLEADEPVDDLVVQTANGGLIFVNVKTSVDLSARQGSALESVFDQFVRQWLVTVARPLDVQRDRLVLAVDATQSGALVRASRDVLQRVADHQSIRPVSDIAKTEAERRFLSAAESHISMQWRIQKNASPTTEDIAQILQLVQIIDFAFEGGDLTRVTTVLRDTVLSEGRNAKAAWTLLVDQCRSLAKNRSGGGLAVFREVLRKEGLPLRQLPDFAADIRALQDVTRQTLQRLKSFSFLPPTPLSKSNGISIDRACTRSLVAQAKTSSFVVTGEAGAGKSGALYDAANELSAAGHPIVLLAVDRHPVGTLAALRSDIGLTHEVVDVLNAWTSDKPGIVLIDALDASRGNSSERVFQELIASILAEVPSWNVVASIREFDLRFGVKYRSLFRGVPGNADFASPMFSEVRHIHVRKFSSAELSQVAAWFPEIAFVLDKGGNELRELLTSPFNLFLLTTIVAGGALTSELADIATQVDLLDKYWSNRLDLGDQQWFDRERLLTSITNQMICERDLSCSVAKLSPDGRSLEKLLSAGILVPTRSRTQDEVSQVAYAHHRLFDYSVARLSFDGGREPSMAEQVAEEDRTLLLAPGVTLALQMLWEEDDTRESFWRMAIAIAKRSQSGFAHTLPARVAAEATRTRGDFKPLLDRIRKPGEEKQLSLSLIRHIFSVLIAEIVPVVRTIGAGSASWCAILEDISEAAIADTVYPLFAAAAKWVEKPELLTVDQKLAINIVARRLLEHASRQQQYQERVVTSSIQAITRTIEAAPEESKAAVHLLLLPENVNAHGHQELFWLAQAFKPVLQFAPDLLADIYRAVYGTELPSSEEKTTLGGSRILPLTSTKRQDFQLARHILDGHVSEFLKTSPEHALPALINSIGSLILSEHHISVEPTLFRLQNRHARFQPDNSYMWWTPDARESPATRNGLLDELVDGLVQLSEVKGTDAFRDSIDVVVRTNPWAAVWAATLRAALRMPFASAYVALPLICSPTILSAAETRKPAGDLISFLHPQLDIEGRSAIESAVMQIPDHSVQDVLIACMRLDHIVTATIRQRLEQLSKKGGLPENRPPFEVTVGWGRSGDDWYYAEAGIDLSAEPNATLLAAAKKVESLKVPDGQDALIWLSAHWSQTADLHKLLLANPNAPERLRHKGWDALAEAALHAADACKAPTDVDQFPDIETIIRGALRQVDATQQPDEAGFEKSPSWGRPAPRIEAADSLMAFVRARNSVTEDLADLMRALSRDPFPEVRHQVLARINSLYFAAPELMWDICGNVFSFEQNKGVLHFFLHAFSRIIAARPAWATEQLLALSERMRSHGGGQEEFDGTIVPLLLTLWFAHDQKGAGDVIADWAAHPMENRDAVLKAIGDLRGALVTGSPVASDSKDEVARVRAVTFFEAITTECAAIFARLVPLSTLSDLERAQVENALRILDMVAREIYFGSGAYAASEGHTSSDRTTVVTDVEVRRRFLREMTPTLRMLAGVGYPSVTHHLLETLETFIQVDHRLVFQLVVRAVLEGGKYGGYQFESLGADLFVKIIRRYLADYRPWLMEDGEARSALVKILDLFAEVGWPEARRLVYELPEVLR